MKTLLIDLKKLFVILHDHMYTLFHMNDEPL